MLCVEMVVGRGGLAADLGLLLLLLAVVLSELWVARLPGQVNLRFLRGLRRWLLLLPSWPWHLTILAVSVNMHDSDREMKEERSFSSWWVGRFRRVVGVVDAVFVVMVNLDNET